jgi:hypothetical protein
MAMGGIGEAAVLQAAFTGAAAGGIGGAITGADPLKSALIGAVTGGAGGLLSGAGGIFGGAEAAGLAAAEAAPLANLAPTIANANAMTATAAPAALTGLSGAPGTLGSGTFGMLPEAATNFASAAPGIDSLFSNAAPAVAQAAPAAAPAIPSAGSPPSFMDSLSKMAKDPTEYIKDNKYKLGAAALAGAIGGREDPKEPDEYNGPLRRFVFNPSTYRPAILAGGGIANLASGGYDRVVGDEPMNPAYMARGGISDLGGYSDYARGGRMLKGPGDGMSDSIPASIAGRRPARLANEEFVVPADVVSHLGNGSSDAGAKQLYAMMDRVRKARTGRKSQGREINPRKYMFA